MGTLIASGGTESLHVLASDGLGSVSVALDPSGNATAQQLYGPYGGVRYSWGTMPTAKGYTGQQGDSLTGLDYYGARYYDPLVGQFTTPDDVDAAGPNRYGYVGGNPETRTDPTGHLHTCMEGCGNGASHDGVTASACAGYHHCIILIGGVSGGPGNTRKKPSGFGADESFWSTWMLQLMGQYNGDVGFVLYEAPDDFQGANQLHSLLGGLGSSNYGGTISVVGESNGAATIFNYMAESALGRFSGDARINKFVTLDAPSGTNALLAGPLLGVGIRAVAHAWSEWSTAATAPLAALYMSQHHTQGVYAYNRYDVLSGPIYPGPWIQYVSSDLPPGVNIIDQRAVHNALVTDPSMYLIDAAMA